MLAASLVLGYLWLKRMTRNAVVSFAGVVFILFASGTRWLLLKRPEHLDDRRHERERLQEALALNQSLATAYYLAAVHGITNVADDLQRKMLAGSLIGLDRDVVLLRPDELQQRAARERQLCA